MLKIRRALISVWDKKGIVDFARNLTDLKIEIVSTGKTAKLLRNSGIPVKDVGTVTSFPEILSGRVKTLHPKIFGGILTNKKHPFTLEPPTQSNINKNLSKTKKKQTKTGGRYIQSHLFPLNI